MSINFNRKCRSGKSVAQVLFQPMKDSDIVPKIVDIGARSGMFDIPDAYSSNAKFIGFEPNIEEYNKLITGTTNAQKRYKNAIFLSQEYFNTAIWSSEGQKTLYITQGSGACTLMGPDCKKITDKMFLDGDTNQSYSANHTNVINTNIVDCKPLDMIIDETIDYLKVDVEGGELDVFQGAEKLFSDKNILFIKSEFFMTPYYEKHIILGHQHKFLCEKGLRLIDFDTNHPRYSRYRTKIPQRSDRRLIYGGDAYYAIDPDLNELPVDKLHRLAVISIAYGFHSFGVGLLRDAGLLSGKDIDEIEQTLCHLPFQTRLKHQWNDIPGWPSKIYWKLKNMVN